MDTVKRSRLFPLSICSFLFVLSACVQSASSPTVVPPTLIPTVPTQTTVPTETPLPPLLIFLTPTPTCIDGLTFVADVTIPDNTIVAAGSTLDKQWLVQNSGSCNWDNLYRLRLINGVDLDAAPEQALYPARAGIQATLQIIFIAPLEIGEYLSEWQAFDAKGIPFGDAFFIKIVVQ
jgi:hypothetical protein